jgi:hypothetical protein
MSPHEQNDDLGRLLNDAVSDIEPRSGIQAIRSRTSAKESVMTTTRNWIFGAFGAAVATAAVITGVVLAGNNNPSADDDTDPAGTSSVDVTDVPSEDPTADPTDDPTDPVTSEPPAGGGAVPVYYVGDTPQGLRLYREFQRSGEAGDAITAAADLAVSGDPADPDYRTLWPAGTSAYASYDGDVITVTVESADAGDLGLHDLPSGMTADEASLAIQQVIYSVQGALGEGRPGVQFLLNGDRTDRILGQPASEPLANDPVLETLSLMNITSPEEGAAVSGKFEATGVNNGFEGSVACFIRDGSTDLSVDAGIGGFGPGKLFPWTLEVDTAGIAPGTYTFFCSNDDPSDGEEGFGPHTDSKIITIK